MLTQTGTDRIGACCKLYRPLVPATDHQVTVTMRTEETIMTWWHWVLTLTLLRHTDDTVTLTTSAETDINSETLLTLLRYTANMVRLSVNTDLTKRHWWHGDTECWHWPYSETVGVRCWPRVSCGVRLSPCPTSTLHCCPGQRTLHTTAHCHVSTHAWHVHLQHSFTCFTYAPTTHLHTHASITHLHTCTVTHTPQWHRWYGDTESWHWP